VIAVQDCSVIRSDSSTDPHLFQLLEQAIPRWLRELLLGTPPLYATTLALLGGDALGNLHVFMPEWMVVAAVSLCACLFLLRLPALGMLTALVGLTSAATLSVSVLLKPGAGPQTLQRFPDGAHVTLEGWLTREPENQPGNRTYLYLDVRKGAPYGSEMRPVTGLVRVTVPGSCTLDVGDRLTASGKIRFPRNEGDENEFDYRAWLMRQRVVATLILPASRNKPTVPLRIIGHRRIFPGEFLQSVRNRIRQFIDRTLSFPERAELRALVIGDRGEIDPSVRQSFALTGMAHLLVISGLHLGFVAASVFLLVRLLLAAFESLSALGYANKIAVGAAALAVVAYSAIVGGHISTTRALIMVLAFGLATLLDRTQELLASLALAAMIICVLIPGSTADIGFQLSFASVGAILLGMRRFSAWWRWHYANPLGTRGERRRLAKIVEWLAAYIAVSFWAMIGTAPLTAFHFNQFSLVGLVANPIVVPLMGFGAVVSGLVAAACSFIYEPMAQTFLIVAGKFAAVATLLARWFALWPCAWVRTFTPTPLELLIAYGLILLWLSAPLSGAEVLGIIHRRHPTDPSVIRYADIRMSDRNILPGWRSLLAGLLLTALLFDAGWSIYQRYLNPALRVTFLSVGEGDSAVVRFPGARVMLIDGGGGFRGTFDPGERIVAHYLWAHKIMHVDYIVLSHPDRDHFGGLTFVVRNFSPSEFWTAGTESTDTSYQELLAAVRLSGARRHLCDSASPSIIVGGVLVACLGPQHGVWEVKHNDASMVLRLSYGNNAFLFPGDLEAKGERQLIDSRAVIKATILKVPHHGSHTSSTADFIRAVHPKVAVISLGYLNRFGFPAPEVIRRYQNYGVEVVRTDEDGAVSIVADRNSSHLSTFRPVAGRDRK
jgi:competence protein ComEC